MQKTRVEFLTELVLEALGEATNNDVLEGMSTAASNNWDLGLKTEGNRMTLRATKKDRVAGFDTVISATLPCGLVRRWVLTWTTRPDACSDLPQTRAMSGTSTNFDLAVKAAMTAIESIRETAA